MNDRPMDAEYPKKSPAKFSKKRFNQMRRHRNDRAQAAAEPERTAPVLDHPLVPAGEPELIVTTDRLLNLLEHIRQVGSFAYDTEFIGESSYYPRLCLIQLATHERVALVDPFEDVDLSSLWHLIADDHVETVVHAGLQDLEPVMRHVGRPPARIFDTQIAAGFMRLTYPVALGKLLEEMLGARLGKGLTFTAWDARPLSTRHLRYAADDVRYLPAVKARMQQRLQTLGHDRWAAEEFAALGQAAQELFDPAWQLERVQGSRALKPKHLTVLRTLVAVRDQAAREHDLPPRSVLKDQILIELARNPVRTVQQLRRVRGLPMNVQQGYGQQLVDATLAALNQPIQERPAANRGEESPALRAGIDSLYALAVTYCQGRGIDPILVTSRHEVGGYYRALNAGVAPGPDVKIAQGWRYEFLGRLLEQVVQGARGVHLQWRDGHLQADAVSSSSRS